MVGFRNAAAPTISLLLLVSCLGVASADPNSYKQLALGMNALSKGESDDAMKHFQSADAADPSSADGALGMAVLHRKAGNALEARREIDRALALEPTRASLWQTSAEIALMASQHEKAISDASRAIQLDDETTVAYFTRGVALREIGRPDEAIDDLGVAITRVPNVPKPLLERGRAYARLGRGDEAIADFEAALANDPDNADATRELAAAKAAASVQIAVERTAPQDEAEPDDGGIGWGAPPDDEENVRRLLAKTERLERELGALPSGREDSVASSKRAAEICGDLETMYGKSIGMFVSDQPNAASITRYKDAIQRAWGGCGERRRALDVAARDVATETAASRLGGRADDAAARHAADIEALGVAAEVLDSRIVLRGLVGGMEPTPWITLRRWVALLLDDGTYKVVDVRRNEEEMVWALVLKKPAQPAITLGFRYDYGDLFSHFIETGDRTYDMTSPGAQSQFDGFLTSTVGFTWEDLFADPSAARP